jgi:hypothetical protein
LRKDIFYIIQKRRAEFTLCSLAHRDFRHDGVHRLWDGKSIVIHGKSNLEFCTTLKCFYRNESEHSRFKFVDSGINLSVDMKEVFKGTVVFSL